MDAKTTIETVLNETRSFPPPEDFAQQAHLGNVADYEKLWQQSQRNPVQYWEGVAKKHVWWETPWKQAFEWSEPFSKWFIGGKTNAAYNCLDRHLREHGDKLALIFEAEDGRVENWTYKQLHREVCRFANALLSIGAKPGSPITIYLPMVPEAIIAMLACARIGAPHSVIFAGFAATAIRDRVLDASSEIILTSDVAYRRGTKLDLLKTVEEAVKQTPAVHSVVVLQREKTNALSGVFKDWSTLIARVSEKHEAKAFDSEHPLFFLYTSGTTGKPKGIVHTTGGYLTSVISSAHMVFDLKKDDIYWCTADIGWVTGHSYIVYGLLGNAATCVLFEGALNFPHPGRIWEIVDKHEVSILYTAPTAIRSFMRTGEEHVDKYKLDTLRLLGSVGEPINPEAWMWYHRKIGKEQCPIVDTWWQTETGGMMITPLPGVIATKPGSATRPLPGIVANIVREDGSPANAGEGGYLVIEHPWPSMLRAIHRDPERFKETYWSKFKGKYFTGDGASRDADGFYWIKGRVDDVLNVSGHRLGTMEIESALVSHPYVAEAAVVGKPDELKGQAVVAFVTPKDSAGLKDFGKATTELKAHVAKEIGAIARPDEIRWTKTLPKTRSGKIMRRLLKDLAAGKEVTGDTTTLENPGLVEYLH
jgi:acetyl-CoA synthetase